MPCIQGWFYDKILAELVQTSNYKNTSHLKMKITSNEKNWNYHSQTLIIKTVFYSSTYILINKYSFMAWKSKSQEGCDSLKFRFLSFMDIWQGLISDAKSQNIEV